VKFEYRRNRRNRQLKILKNSMPMRLVEKEAVGETPTGATETVALPGTEELPANRMGMQEGVRVSIQSPWPAFRDVPGFGFNFPEAIDLMTPWKYLWLALGCVFSRAAMNSSRFPLALASLRCILIPNSDAFEP
jgi:hypothetical protein